jgi:hypothetical protein
MGPEAILLSVREDGNEGSYRFTCPSCADDVEKRADRKIVALLVSAGVDLDQAPGGQTSLAATHPELFDELGEELRDLGPAFTQDDVIEFHYLLEDDAYIRDFLASSGGY